VKLSNKERVAIDSFFGAKAWNARYITLQYIIHLFDAMIVSPLT